MSQSEPTFAFVDPTRETGWDTMVARFPDSTVFHTMAWPQVLKASYGYSPRCLTLSRSGEVKACLPLVEVDSWLTGRRAVCLPFTDACAPLAFDPADARRLISRAVEVGRVRRWRYLLAHGGGELGKSPATTPSYYSHDISLASGANEVFRGFDESVRRAIKKAQRDGVSVEVASNIESVRSFYSLHCLTRQRHGLPPQPWAFFAQIHRHLIGVGQGFVGLARHQGRAIAGGLFLQAGRKAMFKFGASDKACQALRPNNLVMWEAIQQLIRHGVKLLDLGRTSLANEGLRRFKLGWGAAERLLWYLRYEYSPKAFVVERDAVDGWYNDAFRTMPRLLSRLTGAFLYRHWG